MKVKRKVFGNRLEIEVEGEKETDLFNGLAKTEQLFGLTKDYLVEKCGCCKKTDLKFQVRQAEDTKKKGKFYDYYELVCKNPDCYAKLSFGQLQEPKGGLFPKKDENGNYWVQYKKEDDGK